MDSGPAPEHGISDNAVDVANYLHQFRIFCSTSFASLRLLRRGARPAPVLRRRSSGRALRSGSRLRTRPVSLNRGALALDVAPRGCRCRPPTPVAGRGDDVDDSSHVRAGPPRVSHKTPLGSGECLVVYGEASRPSTSATGCCCCGRAVPALMRLVCSARRHVLRQLLLAPVPPNSTT